MKNKKHPLTFFREAQENRAKGFKKYQDAGETDDYKNTGSFMGGAGGVRGGRGVPGVKRLDGDKVSSGVKNAIKFLQEGKEGGGGYEKFYSDFKKLSKAQQDSVIKFQDTPIKEGYHKKGGSVKTKKKK